MKLIDWRRKFFSGKFEQALEDLTPHLAVLETLVSSTEKEFLAAGDRLQDIYRRADETAGLASEAADRMSGGDMASIRKALGAAAAGVETLTCGLEKERDVMLTIQNSFEGLRQPLESFVHVVRLLTVLGNFIKIEMARLGLQETSFEKLTQDIDRLVRVIGDITGSLADQAQSVVSSLEAHRALLEAGGVRQKDCGRKIFARIEANLADMSAVNDASFQSVEDISRAWKNISLSVGEAVSSLQFHDITRQRVEHVYEALREAAPGAKRFGDGNGKGQTNAKSAGPEALSHLFTVQAAQLADADADLADAVSRLSQSLRNVAAEARGIAKKAPTIAGGTGKNRDAFWERMTAEIRGLAQGAGEAVRIRRELGEAMAALAQTAQGMSVFVRDMEKIGIEMQRLALNARVHAAHLGDCGATLGVLAESIHSVSTDTALSAERILSGLKEGMENAARLREMAQSGEDRSLTEISEDFIALVDPLQQMESQMDALLGRTEQVGVSLADDIEHLVADLHLTQKIHAGLSPVCAYLGQKAEQFWTDQSDRAAFRKALHLDDLSTKYTMHRERKTHLLSIGKLKGDAAPVVSVPTPANYKQNHDELGDNVELF